MHLNVDYDPSAEEEIVNIPDSQHQQGRSQDFEKGEANVRQGGAEGTYN